MLNGVSLLLNSCFKDRIRRCFYIALWPATKNGSTTIILSAENNGERLYMPPRRRPDRIFTVLRLCSAFGGTSSVRCIMSCWNRVKPSQGIGIERNWSAFPLLWKSQKLYRFVDRLKRRIVCSRWYPTIAIKMEKSSGGQYFKSYIGNHFWRIKLQILGRNGESK